MTITMTSLSKKWPENAVQKERIAERKAMAKKQFKS